MLCLTLLPSVAYYRHMSNRTLHGPAVRAIREALGIKHGRFALDVGITPGYLSNVEKGRKQPSDAVAAAIAKRLGVTIDEITYGHERAAS